MKVTTTYGSGGPRAKGFSWSFSKLKNFETCPKRYWHIDVAKDIKEPEGEALVFGNMLHDALANRIGKGTPLPKSFESYEPWAEKMVHGKDKGAVVLVEQKLAIDKDYGAVSFFDNTAWFRGVADVIKIAGPVALVADWKTGKIVEDSQQLALIAACVFAHHPSVQKIRSEFIWLKEDATTRIDVTRSDIVKMWAGLTPRISALEEAHKTTTFPPKPSGLCRRFCPVTVCPHCGT